MLCTHHSRLLLSSLTSAVQSIFRDGSLQSVALQMQQFSTGNSSSSSSSTSDPSDNTLADFQQRVAALQDSQTEPSLKALKNAAAGSTLSQAAGSGNSSSSADSSIGSSAADVANSSSKPSVAVDPKYGYAVLGGVNPEASQQEAGAQQPKLHPSRDFRHGDTYEPTELSPLAKEEQEAWLPKQRRWRRPQKIPAADVARLDYKNVDLLLKFVSDSGRLLPRRVTGLKPIAQARAARTVKLARQMALFPYEMRVGDGSEGDRWRRMRDVEAAQRSRPAAR